MSSASSLNNRAENRQFEQVNNGANPILKPMQNASEINVIEQHLQQNEMTAEQRSTILEAIHRILPPEIRILQDTTHNQWICIHYMPNTKKPLRKVLIYHPSQGFDYQKFHQNDKKVIDEWYKESNWKAREGLLFMPYLEASGHQDEFLFVLALALYVATEQTLSNLEDCLDKGTENIRQVIMKVLMNGSLPHDSEAIRQQPISIDRTKNQQVENGCDDSALKTKLVKNIASKNAIELILRQEDLTDDKKEGIVEVMHQILPNKIRILKDNGHGSWICVEEVLDRIHFYTPCLRFESTGVKDEDQRIIDDWYGRPGWKPREFTVFKPCLKATRVQDEFIFVLAYALCRAMGQSVSDFKVGLCHNNSTQYVRRVIVELVLKGEFSNNDPNATIWEHP